MSALEVVSMILFCMLFFSASCGGCRETWTEGECLRRAGSGDNKMFAFFGTDQNVAEVSLL